MTLSRRRHGKKLPAMAAAVLLIFSFAALFPQEAEAGLCEGAVVRCLIDAGLASLAGLVGGGAGVAALAGTLGAFCLNGYIFCKVYCMD